LNEYTKKKNNNMAFLGSLVVVNCYIIPQRLILVDFNFALV